MTSIGFKYLPPINVTPTFNASEYIYEPLAQTIPSSLNLVDVKVGNGTVSAPSYSFTSTTNTGMYRASDGTLSFTHVGSRRLGIGATETTSLNRIFAPDGSATLPSYSFANSQTMGMYLFDASTLAFNSPNITTLIFGGVQRITFDQNRMRGGNGSLTSPAYSFLGDTNSGLYWISADAVGMAAGGTQSQQWVSGGTTIGTNGTQFKTMKHGEIASQTIPATSTIAVVVTFGGTLTGSLRVVATMKNATQNCFVNISAYTTTTFTINIFNTAAVSATGSVCWILIEG